MSTKKKAPAKAETKTKWPIKRTVRKLPVPLTDEDVRNLGRENAHIGAEIEALSAEKKTSNQNYTASITALNTRRSVNDTAISNGRTETDVECEWRYEQNRAGKPDKARKVLVRLDTEKVVDEAFITDDERQTTMKLDPVEKTGIDPEAAAIVAAEAVAEGAAMGAALLSEKKKGKGKAKKETPAPSEAAQEQDKKTSDAEAKANS